MPKTPTRSSKKRTSHFAAPRKQAIRARTRKIIRLPYLKRLGERGPVSIWQVDGSYVRTHIDEEFTNYGQHYSYTYIPKDEFWIDQGNRANWSAICASIPTSYTRHSPRRAGNS